MLPQKTESSLALFHKFDSRNCIFIDESTVRATKNANLIWYEPIEGETRLRMLGKYAHLITVHCIGGISRLGRTESITFTGILIFFIKNLDMNH